MRVILDTNVLLAALIITGTVFLGWINSDTGRTQFQS
jgi:predicted nucleic acid-binding protein